MKLSELPVKQKKVLKDIILHAYPDYTGRKMFLVQQEKIKMDDNYWDGGTRTYYKFLRSDGKSFNVPSDNPFKDNLEKEVVLNESVICITHAFFCGHDCGCTIYYSGNLKLLQG